MTMTDAAINKSALPINLPAVYLSAVLGLVIAADWLFYNRAVGISALLFLAAVFAVSAFANRKPGEITEVMRASVVFASGGAPLAYELNILSVSFAIVATALASQMIAHPTASWRQRLDDCSFLLPDMVWRWIADLSRGWQTLSQAKGGAMLKSLTAWVVPLALGAIFISLFASANPIIDDWFAAVDWKAFLQNISFPRILFWLLVIAAVWPLVFLRNRKLKAAAAAKAKAATPSPDFSVLFGKTAILRSLTLFNVLFAVQTALDIAYLWGGLELPHGMNYASYAHRGAYPLIATALLAAVFVLIATRPGSEVERSPLIRKLVYLWTAQNVLLVISSLMRLSLYVAVYSLTYWRVAALIWMVLVAIGLVLIVARLVLNRSSLWLVGTNVASLTLTLYLCCFVNFPLMIANYNVDHSSEIFGRGIALDLTYLASLGPHALPAIDRYLLLKPDTNRAFMYRCLIPNAERHLDRMDDWRAWTYLDWQLARYLRERNSRMPGFTPASN
jgi:hypothetical protein